MGEYDKSVSERPAVADMVWVIAVAVSRLVDDWEERHWTPAASSSEVEGC